MNSVRAGVVGLGVMGRNHVRVMSSLPDVEIVGASDPQPSGTGSILGCPVYTDIEDLIRLGLDYCVVATPTSTHEQIACRLASAGVHCLIEKPVAHTVQAAAEMVATFEKYGVLGAVGHVERFNSAVIQAKARMSSGGLGQIYQVLTRRQGPFAARVVDVGVAKDLASHDIDLTMFITGAHFRSVTASAASPSGRPYEDLLIVGGHLTDDTMTNHVVNWLSPFKERQTLVTGEKGSFLMDTLTADLTFFENGAEDLGWPQLTQFRGYKEGSVTRFAFPKQEALLTEHLQFLKMMRGEANSSVSLLEGLGILEVIDAILVSASTSQVVVLPGDQPPTALS